MAGGAEDGGRTAMEVVRNGAGGACAVLVPEGYMEDFLRRCPCHGLEPVAFECAFDDVGNLVDLTTDQDGWALSALVAEAQAVAMATGALGAQLTMKEEDFLAHASSVTGSGRAEMLPPGAAEALASAARGDWSPFRPEIQGSLPAP